MEHKKIGDSYDGKIVFLFFGKYGFNYCINVFGVKSKGSTFTEIREII